MEGLLRACEREAPINKSWTRFFDLLTTGPKERGSRPLQALSPLQAGRMLVESFPYLPDLIALVRELANERKAPSAEELLKTGALRYMEKQGAADVKASHPCFLTSPEVHRGGFLRQGSQAARFGVVAVRSGVPLSHSRRGMQRS